MKTWEMIKALTENPKKKFHISNGPDGYVEIMNNKVVWQGECIEYGEEFPLHIVLDDSEWEEVKQPVSWQEALEAWATGKAITLKINGVAHCIDYSGLALNKKDIQNGEWYILENQMGVEE